MIRLRLRLAPRGAEVWAEGHAGYAAPGATRSALLVSTRMICSGMQNAVMASRPVLVVDTNSAMPITRVMAS